MPQLPFQGWFLTLCNTYFGLDMRYAHALIMSDIWDKKISDVDLDFTKDLFNNTSAKSTVHR